MVSKSIYPSIPAPGNTVDTILPAVNAMRQTLNLMILNAQKPNPNYTPSSAAQVFLTKDDIAPSGAVVGPPGQPGPPGPPGEGIDEAPDDVNTYGRSQLAWTPVLRADGSTPIQTGGNPVIFQTAPNLYGLIINRDPANNQGWGLVFGGYLTNPAQQFAIINPQGQPILWIGSDGVIHVRNPIVVGP